MNRAKPSKIRVLIVEDSRVVREYLEHIVGRDPRLEVAGAVGSAEEALRLLDPASPQALCPDVISMDIRLPGINGFEATERIMAGRPTPIVVVSASVESQELRVTMNALEAGALTVVEKPLGTASEDYQAMASRLCTQLAIMSQVKVVRRHAARPAWTGTKSRPAPDARGYRVLGIVSSTGGPNALVRMLGGLGAGFPLPIVLVQHIAGGFLEGFASWLESACPFSVAMVRDPVRLEPGNLYLPARDHHLTVKAGYAQAEAGDPVSAQRPSGTVLFGSMAHALGGQGLGVLLTGMGEDGAEGLLRLRANGGYTIAEHESTAVVYGMPGEAVRIGAACESLPLPSIAPRILELTAKREKVA